MKKLLSLLGVGMLVAMWSGCGITGPVSAPTVEIDAIGAINAGTYKNVTGKVTGDTVISKVSYSIDPENAGITVVGPSAGTNEKTININADNPITITVAANVQDGSYNLKISVTAGPTAELSFPFTVTGSTGTPVASKTVTLGAQSAAEPSLLDADLMTVYSNTTTDANLQANADAIFSYSTVLTPAALAFTSPSVAAGSPYSAWATKAASEFKKVTVADLTTIDTQEKINALWTGAGETRIALAQGDVIVVKTSAGVYKLVSITTINGADASATMTILGKY